MRIRALFILQQNHHSREGENIRANVDSNEEFLQLKPELFFGYA